MCLLLVMLKIKMIIYVNFLNSFYSVAFLEKSESDETIPGDSNTNINNLGIDDALDKCSMGSSCVSPVSSQGGVYSVIHSCILTLISLL